MKSKKDNREGAEKQKICGDTLVECPKCNESSIVDAWENMTQSSCESRKARRDYVKLSNAKAFKREAHVIYRCPECGEYSNGFQLKVAK